MYEYLKWSLNKTYSKNNFWQKIVKFEALFLISWANLGPNFDNFAPDIYL